MNASFHNESTRQASAFTPPFNKGWREGGVSRIVTLCLAMLSLTAAGARGQSIEDAGRARGGPQGMPFVAALWQQDGPPGPPPGVPVRRGSRNRPGPPPGLVERLRNLSPEQRERVLENNRRFQQLPPERQDQLRRRLRQLQEMTPEQRELIEQRFSSFNNLSAKQQEKARQIYEDRWRQMPPERRRALLEEFRRLRRLEPAERHERLESKEFQDQFSQQERDVLSQLIAL